MKEIFESILFTNNTSCYHFLSSFFSFSKILKPNPMRLLSRILNVASILSSSFPISTSTEEDFFNARICVGNTLLWPVIEKTDHTGDCSVGSDGASQKFYGQDTSRNRRIRRSRKETHKTDGGEGCSIQIRIFPRTGFPMLPQYTIWAL